MTLKPIDDELPKGVTFTRLKGGVRLQIDGKISECSRHESEWLNKCEALAQLKLIHKFPEPIAREIKENHIVSSFKRSITEKRKDTLRQKADALSHVSDMLDEVKTAIKQLANELNK